MTSTKTFTTVPIEYWFKSFFDIFYFSPYKASSNKLSVNIKQY